MFLGSSAVNRHTPRGASRGGRLGISCRNALGGPRAGCQRAVRAAVCAVQRLVGQAALGGAGSRRGAKAGGGAVEGRQRHGRRLGRGHGKGRVHECHGDTSGRCCRLRAARVRLRQEARACGRSRGAGFCG